MFTEKRWLKNKSLNYNKREKMDTENVGIYFQMVHDVFVSTYVKKKYHNDCNQINFIVNDKCM